MTSKRRSFVPVVVGLSLAAAASGCEIIANFDRSLIPDEGGTDAPYEATYPDGAVEDTSTPTSDAPAGDTSTTADGGGGDSSATDSSSTDGTAGDSSTADSEAVDSGSADSEAVDSGSADSSAVDTGVADTGVADTGADTSQPIVDASDDGG